MIGILWRTGGGIASTASTTCGGCHVSYTVPLREIAAADGVLICSRCGEAVPLCPERLAFLAAVLRRERADALP